MCPSPSSPSFPFWTLILLAAIPKLSLANSMCFFGDGHCLRFRALTQLPNTKYDMYVYPNWHVCPIDCPPETLFGVPTWIGAEQIMVLGTQSAVFHLNLTKFGVGCNIIGGWQYFHQSNWCGVLLISCTYEDHRTFVAIYNDT